MSLRIGIFYLLTWFFLILLGGIQQETGLFPPEFGLAQWGPGLAGLVMLLLFRKDGHKIAILSKGIPLTRYLAATLLPAGVGLIVFAIMSLFPLKESAYAPVYGSIPMALLWMPLGALGEEIGWRGYLHKRLNPNMKGLTSSLLVGLLWAPIHVHFFGQGALFLFFLALSILSFSVVLYALVQDTGFNVLLATIFHLSINLTNLLFLDVIYEATFMTIYGVTWAIVAGVFVFTNRKIFLVRKS